jgi:hypothetical protein
VALAAAPLVDLMRCRSCSWHACLLPHAARYTATLHHRARVLARRCCCCCCCAAPSRAFVLVPSFFVMAYYRVMFSTPPQLPDGGAGGAGA